MLDARGILAPNFLELPQIPPSVFEYLDLLRKWVDDVSGTKGFVVLALLLFCLPAVAQVNCNSSPSPCVTITGGLSASNGLPASNYIISFRPTSLFYIAGSGQVINTTTYCGTSTDGTVVGIPNPSQQVVISTGGIGTLPASTYYVKYAFYSSSPSAVTLAGSEQQVVLNTTGRLTVNAPPYGIPSTATGMNVYIGTASGAETLQGQTTGVNSYIQGVPLVNGAALPSSNTSVCKQVANDAGWPTGTGYQVALSDQAGNTVPPYPMQWQLLGPGTTVNVGNGLPYYHGVTLFPTPLLLKPPAGGAQQVVGTVDVTGVSGNQGITPHSICPNGTPGPSTFCAGDGTWKPGSGSGVSWPGSPSIMYALNSASSRAAVATDVIGLFSGTPSSSCYLNGAGACTTPAGAGNVTTTGFTVAPGSRYFFPSISTSTDLETSSLVYDAFASPHFVDFARNNGAGINLGSPASHGGGGGSGSITIEIPHSSWTVGTFVKNNAGTWQSATNSDTNVAVFPLALLSILDNGNDLIAIGGVLGAGPSDTQAVCDMNVAAGHVIVLSSTNAPKCTDGGSAPATGVFVSGMSLGCSGSSSTYNCTELVFPGWH